jgi:hypothetical protein
MSHNYQHKKYTPTARDLNRVPPNEINIMTLPVYVPPKNAPARAGADDHLKFRSLKCPH